MKTVIKICPTDFLHESRDEREITTLMESGFNVEVIAKEIDSSVVEKKNYNVLRLSTRPLGERVPNALNRAVSCLLWAKETAKHDPDVISGHDMVAAYIGVMSSIGKKKRPKIIYDSHEFELGRNANRNAISKKIVKIAEKHLLKRVDETIVVNQSIADEIQRIYKLKTCPKVVRNIPPQWQLNERDITENRVYFQKKMNVNHLLSYHGMIIPNRGIETVIDLVSQLEDTGAIIVGYANSSDYLESLKEYTKEKGVEKKISFVGAVYNSDLWKYIGAVDISLLVYPPVSKSYYYSLPNKLFEAIQSETPVVASDFPEIKKIVGEYGVGAVARWDDVQDIRKKVSALLKDEKKRDTVKSNLKIAKNNLCWEKEKEILIDIYTGIIDS